MNRIEYQFEALYNETRIQQQGAKADTRKPHQDFSPDESPEDAVETVPRVDEPKMFKVLILNDDYTPMDFVVMVLKRFFAKPEALAIEIMLNVHKNGAGLAGVYPLEVAEMKVLQVNQFSQNNKYPLKCTLEES